MIDPLPVAPVSGLKHFELKVFEFSGSQTLLYNVYSNLTNDSIGKSKEFLLCATPAHEQLNKNNNNINNLTTNER
tara:strand:- start:466 stop:690 length:225 start_codon:yes stop_codon:yes gene_type:complete